jgi:hypothetical protein
MNDITKETKAEKLQKDTDDFISRISDIVVEDQPTYDDANGILKEIKGRIKTINDELEPGKKKAYEAYREWGKLIKKLTDPLLLIEGIVKKKIGTYLQEEERKRQEEIRRREKEAEDEKLKQAAILEKHGMSREADDVMMTKPKVETKDIQTVRKGGTYISAKWHAEVTDFMELIKAVASGDGYPTDLLLPNMSVLNDMARKKHENMAIPGVEAKRDVTVGVR